MDVGNTAFKSEIDRILQGSSNPVHFTYSAVIHVKTTNENYQATKVQLIDISSDFETRYADVTMIKLAIPLGKYAKYIYPNQSNLDITITKTPVGEIGEQVNVENNVVKTRYTAVLVDTGNPTLQQNGSISFDEETMDRGQLFDAYFQLLDKSVDAVRMLSCGGSFRGNKMEDVLRCVLGGASKETRKLIEGVDIVDPSNQAVKENLTIPHGTRVVDVPMFLQKSRGGVYSAGMGYYLWKNVWYVYPCYDTTRLKKSNRNITIVNIPSEKMPGVERTYRKDAGNLVILTTGEVRTKDDSDSKQLNLGSGVRFTDASKVMEESTSTGDNKTVMSRGSLNTEVLATVREDGRNYAPVSTNPITANQLEELSKLTRRMGGVIALVWEHSNPDLIAPGTMVRLKYLKEGAVAETVGVLLKAHHFTTLQGTGVINSRYVTKSVLSIFVQNAQG